MTPEYTIENKNEETLYEEIDFGFSLSNPRNCFATCRDMSLSYLKGELEFYYSGSPFLKDIIKHSQFWKGVSDDGRTINSNYGKLLMHDRNFHNYTQFEYALEMLTRNIESKKAVMVIYGPENACYSSDNPCTMYLQFFARKGLLHLYVKMRSSDVWFGLPYDVPFFVSILFLMKERLMNRGICVEVGTYNHVSGSLHLYERNVDKVQRALSKCTLEDTKKDQKELFFGYVYPYVLSCAHKEDL
jgi:thymidylate synthase